MLKLITGVWLSRRARSSEPRALQSGEAGRDSSAADGDATAVLIKRRTTGAPIPPVSEGARNGQRRKIEMYQIGG